MNGNKFATFGAEYELKSDSKGKCFMRFCTPIRTGLSAKSTEEQEVQIKKEAGVLPPEAKPKTFTLKYGFGLTAEQMKQKDSYIEGGLTEKEATEHIMKETQPQPLKTEPQTTPPSHKVLKASAIAAPPAPDMIGDMKNGPSKVQFLGHTIDVRDKIDNVIDSFNEAVDEATRKRDFNGKYFTNYMEAIQRDKTLQEQEAAIVMALKREDCNIDDLRFKNDNSVLRKAGVEVKVHYK